MDKHFFGLDQISAHDENAAYLTTVHNEAELSILRSILEGEEIPEEICEEIAEAAEEIVEE